MLDKITIEIWPSLTGPWATVTTHGAGDTADKSMWVVSLATVPKQGGHEPLVIEAAQAALRALCKSSLPKT